MIVTTNNLLKEDFSLSGTECSRDNIIPAPCNETKINNKYVQVLKSKKVHMYFLFAKLRLLLVSYTRKKIRNKKTASKNNQFHARKL